MAINDLVRCEVQDARTKPEAEALGTAGVWLRREARAYSDELPVVASRSDAALIESADPTSARGTMRNLYFDWGISDHFGWGIYGYNLLYWSAIHPLFRVVPLKWPPQFLHPPDPVALHLFARMRRGWVAGIRPSRGDVFLRAAGNGILASPGTNRREIAVTFFENNPLPTEMLAALGKFTGVIAGSSWNANALRQMGLSRVHIVMQGVDTDLFRPQDERVFRDRFVVFSGGKLEFRKGQDLVVRAFACFAKRHPEALLVACWRSPWEKRLACSINESSLCTELNLRDEPGRSIRAWLEANGIARSQYICLGAVPNRLMPEVYREADVALFPNRCEGGTNLVAMEAMSSGIPCVLSSNTGHLDLIRTDNCIPLQKQGAVKNCCAREGWGESDLDEIVAALERVYEGRARLDPGTIRQSVVDMSWSNAIEALQARVLEAATPDVGDVAPPAPPGNVNGRRATHIDSGP